jgi:Tfp pilus assembly protein PilV
MPGEPSRQQVAALLQHTYQWTRAAAITAPPVAQQVAPALTVAAQLYEARQYPAAITQLAGVVTQVREACLTYPALPDL